MDCNGRKNCGCRRCWNATKAVGSTPSLRTRSHADHFRHTTNAAHRASWNRMSQDRYSRKRNLVISIGMTRVMVHAILSPIMVRWSICTNNAVMLAQHCIQNESFNLPVVATVSVCNIACAPFQNTVHIINYCVKMINKPNFRRRANAFKSMYWRQNRRRVVAVWIQ